MTMLLVDLEFYLFAVVIREKIKAFEDVRKRFEGTFAFSRAGS